MGVVGDESAQRHSGAQTTGPRGRSNHSNPIAGNILPTLAYGLVVCSAS